MQQKQNKLKKKQKNMYYVQVYTCTHGLTLSLYRERGLRGLITRRCRPAKVWMREEPYLWRRTWSTLDSLMWTSSIRSSTRSREEGLAFSMSSSSTSTTSSVSISFIFFPYMRQQKKCFWKPHISRISLPEAVNCYHVYMYTYLHAN